MPTSGTPVAHRASQPNLFRQGAQQVINANAVIKAVEPPSAKNAREFIRLVKGHPRWKSSAEGLLEVARPGALEEVARICWECSEVEYAKVAEAEAHAEELRQQLNAAQKAYLMEVATLRDQDEPLRTSVNVDGAAILESYEPLRYMDETTKELVLLVVTEQVKLQLSRRDEDATISAAQSSKNAEKQQEESTKLRDQLAEEKKQNEELEKKLREVAEKCADMDFAASVLRQQANNASSERQAAINSHNNLQIQLESAKKDYAMLCRKIDHMSKENDQLTRDKVMLMDQLEERVQRAEPEPPPSPHLPLDSTADHADRKDALKAPNDTDTVETMLTILKDEVRRKDERIKLLEDENDAMQAILMSSERQVAQLRGEVSKTKGFSAQCTQNSWHTPHGEMNESFSASFYGSHSDLVNSVEQTMQRTWQKLTHDMQEQLSVTETKLNKAEQERFYAEQRWGIEKQFKEEAEGLVNVLEQEIHELEATIRVQRQRASSGDDWHEGAWHDDWPTPNPQKNRAATGGPQDFKAFNNSNVEGLQLLSATKQPWPPRSTLPANSGVAGPAEEKTGSTVQGKVGADAKDIPRNQPEAGRQVGTKPGELVNDWGMPSRGGMGTTSRGGLGTATMQSRGDLGTASASDLDSGGLELSAGLSGLRSPLSFGMGPPSFGMGPPSFGMGSRGGHGSIPSRGSMHLPEKIESVPSRGSNLCSSAIPQARGEKSTDSASCGGLEPSSPQKLKEHSQSCDSSSCAGWAETDTQPKPGQDWARDPAPSQAAAPLKWEGEPAGSMPSSAARQKKPGSGTSAGPNWSAMVTENHQLSEKIKELTAENDHVKGSNHRLRLLLDELTARFQRMREAAETKGQTKVTFLAEIASQAGLGEVFESTPKNVFERLYTDALFRLQRLERISNRIHEEEQTLLLGVVNGADLGDSLSARLQEQTRRVLRPEPHENSEVKEVKGPETFTIPNGVAVIPAASDQESQEVSLQGKAAPLGVWPKASNRTDGFQLDADKGGANDSNGRRKTQPTFFPAKLDPESGSPPPPIITNLSPAPPGALYRHTTGRFINPQNPRAPPVPPAPPVLISGMQKSYSDMHHGSLPKVGGGHSDKQHGEQRLPGAGEGVSRTEHLTNRTAEVITRAPKTFTELPRLGPNAFLGGYLKQNRNQRHRGR